MANNVFSVALLYMYEGQDELPEPCPDYSSYAYSKHAPYSKGKYELSYMRPRPACRTFNLSEVEDTIQGMKASIRDPDLFRLFENCFPNTLDTAITWKGFSNETGAEEEELTFITTGDINAMWLRDSANQLQSYKSLLRPNASSVSLASLFRGAINLQARYIMAAPHCNAFNAPIESGLAAAYPFGGGADSFSPSVNTAFVFECKYELDSLAAFLQLSHEYWAATRDARFFAKSQWMAAVTMLLNTTYELLGGTYSPEGNVLYSPYTFQRTTSTSSETLANSGTGSPVKGGTGMVRSAFRPSDDACVFQLFVPANMMFSRYLGLCADIMERIDVGLAAEMRVFADSIRAGIERHGRVHHPQFGKIYAYEVDGFGGHYTMDDANIPSLLSAAMFGYVDRDDEIYQNTRRFVLSTDNPYYAYGPVINSTGGAHLGPGLGWPMALVVQILTSDNDTEIVDSLRQILSSTDGYGLIHESISSQSASIWTRQWFSWANGLFGQMILDIRERKPYILAMSFQ
ncbi:hypothetical protein GQ53DRAFT_797620 [Thozetella sp. PMI_491]|nr:hypothetical protein GQ53DRAFT_797620 [Thozetella sp. PMI_491]